MQPVSQVSQVPSSGMHMVPTSELPPASNAPVLNSLVYANQSYPYYPTQSYPNQPVYASPYSYPPYCMKGYPPVPSYTRSFNFVQPTSVLPYAPSSRDSSCMNMRNLLSEPYQYSPSGSRSDGFDFCASSGDSTVSSDRKRSYSECSLYCVFC